MRQVVPPERHTSKRSGLESATGKDNYIDLEQYTEKPPAFHDIVRKDYSRKITPIDIAD